MNGHTQTDDRFVTLRDQNVQCPECGHQWSGTVEVDTLPGVACATCPVCVTAVEPVPQRAESGGGD